MKLYVARDKETGKLATSWELDVEPLDDNVFLSEEYPADIPMLTIGQYEIVMLKEQSYMFKAIPKLGILDDLDENIDPNLVKFDGTYVYGWYVDGFIVGKVMELDDEYIDLEYWVPVDPETVCLVVEARHDYPLPLLPQTRHGRHQAAAHAGRDSQVSERSRGDCEGGNDMKELTEKDLLPWKDLLPCKFCGEKDLEVSSTGNWSSYSGRWNFVGLVRCRNCERRACADGVHHKNARQLAMKQWNREQEETP